VTITVNNKKCIQSKKGRLRTRHVGNVDSAAHGRRVRSVPEVEHSGIPQRVADEIALTDERLASKGRSQVPVLVRLDGVRPCRVDGLDRVSRRRVVVGGNPLDGVAEVDVEAEEEGRVGSAAARVLGRVGHVGEKDGILEVPVENAPCRAR
jgi:hypothetical protein